MSGSQPAPGAPAASVWLDFDRPPATVRALLFDVDLAVRTKIHRGTRLQWILRGDSGERRLRQTQHILDRLQSEEVVIEEGLGGEWVKRFVEGPNTGTRFVGHVEAQGMGTRVHLSAFVGPNGFAQGLGKLSPVGLEKSMKRLLSEFKRAIEGYEPGRARGEVLAVIAEWGDVAQAMRGLDDRRRSAAVSTLVETAWSIAALDEEVDPAERDAMRAVVSALWHTTIDAETEERMVRVAAENVAKEGVVARCTLLGGRLKTLGFSELGVSLAVLVAEVSHGLDPAELEALQHLAAAAGIDGALLLEIVRRTDLSLSGGERLSRMSKFV
jgi:tellurite resistance protein